MDTAVFYEVVVPLLELDRTALICISTILDPLNYYSKLLELKDERGEPFFQVSSLHSISVCTCMLTRNIPCSIGSQIHHGL